MHYEINVSLNGRHFFATAERSILNETDARRMTRLFREKFPPTQNYEVRCTYIEKTSRSVDF